MSLQSYCPLNIRAGEMKNFLLTVVPMFQIYVTYKRRVIKKEYIMDLLTLKAFRYLNHKIKIIQPK